MISLPSVWFPGLLEKEENFEISLSRLAHTACYTMWIPHSLIFFFFQKETNIVDGLSQQPTDSKKEN